MDCRLSAITPSQTVLQITHHHVESLKADLLMLSGLSIPHADGPLCFRMQLGKHLRRCEWASQLQLLCQ